METLFLRVFTVSAAVSLLMGPLLLCRGRLERRFAPRTRWGLWLAVALALLIVPWIPKPTAPVVVEVPTYTLTLPTRPRSQALPVGDKTQAIAPAEEKAQPALPPKDQPLPPVPVQSEVQAPAQDVFRPEAAGHQTQTSHPAALSLTALAAWLWLMGMAAVLLWQGGRYLSLRRRLLRAARPVSGLESYAAQMDLSGWVSFYHCEAVSGPMTLGVFRPVVLLPVEGLAVAALRHELYHVKRRDVAYKLLLLCACVLHWFNPLVWLMLRTADRDVEACCDAAVVAGQDSGYRRSYGELLLSAAAESRALPFTTRFGGGAEQMRSRLTQLFRPGKQSRALVCGVLALAVVLGSLVACQEEKGELKDGIYCSPYANVVYPVGDAEADGEDYGSIGLSLLQYDEISGPHGKPLGEYTLPLSQDLTLRQLWWGEDRGAGEKGTQDWQRAVHELAHAPMYRDSIFPGTEYLVATVKDGEITRLSWAQVSGEEGPEAVPGEETAAKPLTENTMPTLVYYDPEREFLLYRTVDTAYFRYEDGLEEFRADQAAGRRVLWRCDVSEDEKTVYLSDVYDDPEDREERIYAWDIAGRSLRAVDSIPAGIDHMGHVDPEELFYSGFMNGTSLKSNVIRAKDGTLAGLYIDELIGNTMEYLRLSRMGPDGSYEGGEPFLTPERIPAPGTYTEPDWGFTLDLPEELAGHYVVSRAANSWNFYDKDLYSGGGYLFSLWAEDSQTQLETIKSYPGQWPGKILGEKDGITYTATFWDEDMTTPAERENEGYMARMEAAKAIEAVNLDLGGVIRSSGYLWPLPYTEYGSDRLLGEEDNILRILASEGVTVQSVAQGKVAGIYTHPLTGAQSVVVEHSDGRYSVYGHLEYIQLGHGDQVKRGEIIGFPMAEGGRRWLEFCLTPEGEHWDANSALDPWSVDYRTYDFLPVARDSVTVAGDPEIARAMEDVVYGRTSFYDVERGEHCWANALPQSDGMEVTVRCYAQLDMDNDTIPEVVLWLSRGGNEYVMGSIVLRYQHGTVYGYPMGYRSMELLSLKRDGSFRWSGGAPFNGYGRLQFVNGKAETVEYTWCDNGRYTVDGASATQAEWEAACEREEARADVVWYEPDGSCVFELTAGGRLLTVRLISGRPGQNYFDVDRIEVYEGDRLLQTIEGDGLFQPSGSEAYLWEGIFVNRGYAVGEPEIKDLNFDGSEDFGLLAVSGYPHNVPYSYFLWNEERECFEHSFVLFCGVETDGSRRELVETEYSMTGDIRNRYVYREDGTLRKVN